MLAKIDIVDFFNKEAETAKQNWDALMQLPIEERVAKRKAIKDVYLDKEHLPDTEENYKRLRLKVTNNISDFKEGDPVLLHKEGNSITITCNINCFEDDGNIIVEVFPRNLPYNFDIFYDTPLLLDKDTIDLRPKVYNNFTATLSSDTDYWHRSLLNNKPLPNFRQMSECETELEDTISNFGLNLLPRQKEAILKSMATENYYMIQGPPGTGKSYVLSLIILEELLYFNHRVIIIGPNHMAINNALKHVVKTCPPIVIQGRSII